MKTVSGDLIELAKGGQFELIVHGCNCFCAMGAGIAKKIKKEFPGAYKADLETKKGDKTKLGEISYANVFIEDRKFIVVNAYTQYSYSGSGRKVKYEAIRKAFHEIKNKFSGLKIGYPAIGAGLGGGDWKIISKIIEEELEGEDHTFVEFNP
ncbi:MAG: macro domain-containing protein [Bacteroidota bacterium]